MDRIRGRRTRWSFMNILKNLSKLNSESLSIIIRENYSKISTNIEQETIYLDAFII